MSDAIERAASDGLPMVYGRQPRIIGQDDFWFITVGNRFLNHAGALDGYQELDDGNQWPNREAAAAFLASLTTPAQPQPALACHDCGRHYGDEHGFPDLVVPNDVWQKILPNGNEGGLLCPSCICKRLHDAGIECEGRFRSGPLGAAQPQPSERERPDEPGVWRRGTRRRASCGFLGRH